MRGLKWSRRYRRGAIGGCRPHALQWSRMLRRSMVVVPASWTMAFGPLSSLQHVSSMAAPVPLRVTVAAIACRTGSVSERRIGPPIIIYSCEQTKTLSNILCVRCDVTTGTSSCRRCAFFPPSHVFGFEKSGARCRSNVGCRCWFRRIDGSHSCRTDIDAARRWCILRACTKAGSRGRWWWLLLCTRLGG